MRKLIIFSFILLACGCGIHAKNTYESDFKSYRFEDVVVYLSYGRYPDLSYDRYPGTKTGLSVQAMTTYKLFYEEIVNSLNSKGYKAVRLSDIELYTIGYDAKVKFTNYPLTNISYKFSSADGRLGGVLSRHRTIMFVEVQPGYSTSSNDHAIDYLDRFFIRYALLDSPSSKVIALGPSPEPHSPGKNYQRIRSGIISKEISPGTYSSHDSVTGRTTTHYTTTTKFSGYQQSEEDFIKTVAGSWFVALPVPAAN